MTLLSPDELPRSIFSVSWNATAITAASATPDDRRRDGAAHVPAQRGEHGEAGQQRREARLRERQHEPSPQHGQHRAGGRARCAGRRVQSRNAATADHHEREEPPVHVRVPEDRVHAEVGLELVGGDHLRVPEQLAAVVLPEPDRAEHERQRDEHPEAREHDLAAPAHLAQQREQQREGHVGRTRPARARCRSPSNTAPAARTGPGTRPARASAAGPRPRAPAARRSRSARQANAAQPAGDHEVQRHQQVRGRARRLDRHAERQHRDHHHRQAPRAGARRPTPAGRPISTATAHSAANRDALSVSERNWSVSAMWSTRITAASTSASSHPRTAAPRFAVDAGRPPPQAPRARSRPWARRRLPREQDP